MQVVEESGSHVLVDTGQLDVGGVVSNVHEGGVDHLVVDGVLGARAHTASTGIQIVDEQGGHLALPDDVRRLQQHANEITSCIADLDELPRAL